MSNCPTSQADFDNYEVPSTSKRLNDATPEEWDSAYVNTTELNKLVAIHPPEEVNKCPLGIMQTPEDPNVTAVMQLLKDRADVGMTKYGVTTSQNPLDLIEWLAHLQEELLDAAVYIERTMEELSKK